MNTKAINYSFAKRHGVLITDINENSAKLVYREKLSLMLVHEIRRVIGKPFTFEQVSSETFNKLLTKAYEADSTKTMQMVEGIGDDLDLKTLMGELPQTEDLLETQDDAPIIKLLNALLSEAIKQQASDIHIETFEKTVKIRFRIDGILQEVLQIERILAPLLISRVKVMAKLDIAEKRIPQDGRITLHIAGHTVDVRVSTMPSSHGERIVLRLLDKNVARLDLSLLGIAPATLTIVKQLISAPHGIILVTGPTGSGKTTSLYAMLTELNQSSRNILTVEDPIEFDLPGIGQTQVNPKVNMTFAKGLRAILRQDPDVVMVGEIRDLETAQIAVQASLTGHLVLSTLHTNSAIGAITRLRDMGVVQFLLSSSLLGVIAQRLVRTLCNNCKEAAKPLESEISLLNSNKTLYHAKGCEHCNYSGYIGRTGIYEVIPIDDKLQTMIHESATEQAMLRYARSKTASIQKYGFEKVLEGITTMEEVLRVT